MKTLSSRTQTEVAEAQTSCAHGKDHTHTDTGSVKNKEKLSCHIIFPGLALKVILCQYRNSHQLADWTTLSPSAMFIQDVLVFFIP